jgi:hypothetical protein
MSIRDLTHRKHCPPMLLPYFQHSHGVMDKTLYSKSRVKWFDSILGRFFIRTHIHISNIKFIFFSSEMNQLEIINQSGLRMFIIALQLCFVYEPYEGLRKFLCCFSVSFHPSNTRSRGCQSYQRSQKN